MIFITEFSDKLLALLSSALLALGSFESSHAANHREAPLTALDTKADITDWFAFVSYDDPGAIQTDVKC
jgi:hypothetical protein